MQINPSYMRDNQTKKAQVPCTPAFFFFFFFVTLMGMNRIQEKQLYDT